MKKKIICYVAMFLSGVILLSGCAQLGEKFIRKKKKERVKRYYAVYKYDVHPNIELYEKML